MADGSASPERVAAAALSRRALLTGSAAALPLLVTACRGIQVLGTPPPPPADVRTLQAAIAAEAGMVASYAAALKQLKPPATGSAPDSTSIDIAAYAAVRAVQAEHVAHLTQLKSRLVEPRGARPSAHPPAPSQSPSQSPTGGAGGTAATAARGVLHDLALTEQTASDRLIAELAGLPPSLAQLFASIAASEATHVEYLRSARRGR